MRIALSVIAPRKMCICSPPRCAKEIVRLKGQMEEYAGHLDHLCRNLEVINDAIFNAKEIAECLLDDDPFWSVGGDQEIAGGR